MPSFDEIEAREATLRSHFQELADLTCSPTGTREAREAVKGKISALLRWVRSQYWC